MLPRRSMHAHDDLKLWWHRIAAALFGALRGAGLGAAASGVVALALVALSPSAQAQPGWMQECDDIEALGSLTLTAEGRQLAAELVRQGHPARDYLCLELGWACPALTTPRPEEPEEARCAGAESPDESRCAEPGAAGSWESFVDATLDEPAAPARPLPRFGAACFDDPAACGALPPVEPTPTLASHVVPTLAVTPALVGAPPLELAASSLREEAPHGEGLGPAAGVRAGLDQPPRAQG